MIANQAVRPTSVRTSDLTRIEVLVPPNVIVSDGFLLFDPKECKRKKFAHMGGVLDRFVRLWSKSDDDLIRFATGYGVLGVDERGRLLSDRTIRDALVGRGRYPQVGREPIHLWLDYSKKFFALLRIAARLRDGQHGDGSDWLTLYPNYVFDGTSIESEKLYVELTIGELVLESNLRPVLKWSFERVEEPAIVFGFLNTVTLLDGLLFHLMLSVASVKGLAICGSCPTSFEPDTRARRGTIRYCDDCRASGLAHRNSQQRSMKRKTAILQRARSKGK